MKKLFEKTQKLMLAAVMSVGFMFAVTNINVTCAAWMHQPKPPRELGQYKKIQDD